MTVTDPAAAQTTWTRVCTLAQLIPERGVPALVDGEPIALFLLEDGTVHAIGHHDPFSNANVMARGIVGSVGEAESYRNTVASPMYKQVFDLATGECLSEPGVSLPVWPVRIVDGQVHVGHGGSP
jgi:nitrite reductase (NADH) small subunit